MSRFQSNLDVQQRRSFLSRGSKFPARTKTAGLLLSALGKHDFHICEVVEHEHHIWIRLGCGAIISIYATGTVLVQGRIHGSGAGEAEKLLRKVLPGRVVWKARVDV